MQYTHGWIRNIGTNKGEPKVKKGGGILWMNRNLSPGIIYTPVIILYQLYQYYYSTIVLLYFALHMIHLYNKYLVFLSVNHNNINNLHWSWLHNQRVCRDTQRIDHGWSFWRLRRWSGRIPRRLCSPAEPQSPTISVSRVWAGDFTVSLSRNPNEMPLCFIFLSKRVCIVIISLFKTKKANLLPVPTSLNWYMLDNKITYCRFYKGKKKHVITTQTEHKCVLDSCRQLEAEGIEVGVYRIVWIKVHQGYILFNSIIIPPLFPHFDILWFLLCNY